MEEEAIWRAISAVTVRPPGRIRAAHACRRFVARLFLRLARALEPAPWTPGGVGVVLHPTDFEAVRLCRDTTATGTLGGYLIESPASRERG